jgi:hypothetical protein
VGKPKAEAGAASNGDGLPNGYGWLSLGKVTEWQTPYEAKPGTVRLIFAASRPSGEWVMTTVAARIGTTVNVNLRSKR